MPQANLIRSELYEAQLMDVLSDRTMVKIEDAEDRLAVFPDMGSPLVRPSLTSRYGSNLRKLVVDDCVLIYRHDEDGVRMLCAVPGKAVG